jgi:xylan 1,4-beta-xylosidase
VRLAQLQKLSPVPVFMRVHNLLTSGDGKHALEWGSTTSTPRNEKVK